MAQVELIMPKMGESIMEATILKWVKNVGDAVEVDETILEIATDKVDSEVPAPADGVVSQILVQEGEVAQVGQAIAIISTDGEVSAPVSAPVQETKAPEVVAAPVAQKAAPVAVQTPAEEISKTSTQAAISFQVL